MWERNKLSLAVSAAIASSAAGVASAAEIEEIIVTATKRAESSQAIPIALQAVGGDTLRELRTETFDKYIDYLPNVVSAGNGPGQKEIYIRGSATEQTSVTISAAQGSAPGVALYLDEYPSPSAGATSTFTPPTSSALRCCPARRAPCSAPAPNPAP